VHGPGEIDQDQTPSDRHEKEVQYSVAQKQQSDQERGEGDSTAEYSGKPFVDHGTRMPFLRGINRLSSTKIRDIELSGRRRLQLGRGIRNR
jgi:hypothetical protein